MKTFSNKLASEIKNSSESIEETDNEENGPEHGQDFHRLEEVVGTNGSNLGKMFSLIHGVSSHW